MKKYINEIPLVVRNSIKALSDEKRQGILIYLLRTGPKSFTEIRKDLDISKNNLSYHIKTLVRYGLVYNFYNRNEFDDKYSFYEISKLGKKLTNNLIDLVIPITSKEEFSNIKEAIVSEGEFAYVTTITSDANFIFDGIKTESPQPIIAGTGTIDEGIDHDIINKELELQKIC